jgi:hypothetical protein
MVNNITIGIAVAIIAFAVIVFFNKCVFVGKFMGCVW